MLNRNPCAAILGLFAFGVAFAPTCASGEAVRPWGGTIDRLVFGAVASEQDHGLTEDHTELVSHAGLGEPARRLLPLGNNDWRGGKVAFRLKVDAEKQNYVTVRLWGSDVTANRLLLFAEGKQVGYRHLGDIDSLDIGSDDPFYSGRFYYNTSPLPLSMTKGKTRLDLEIRCSGSVFGYANEFAKFQRPMTEPSRGLYAIYTHLDTFFKPPADEKQGMPPAAAPVRQSPGSEVLDRVKTRIIGEIDQLLASKDPLNQDQIQFLAQAFHVEWTPAFHNAKVAERVTIAVDKMVRDNTATRRGTGGNAGDWYGLGQTGDAIRQVADLIRPRLEERIDTGDGTKTMTRRAVWSEMLVARRDLHRRNRRQYTNQSMINDLYGIYLTNRGIQAIDPPNALSEEQALRYLYESMGLRPWLGSDGDVDAANAREPASSRVGRNYMQFTSKGLSRELGYVGNYGEVLDWASHIYCATTTPGRPDSGDAKIKAQLAKFEQARSYFRYPMLDRDGYRAARLATVIGWRDVHYPGDVTYGERSAWEGSALYSASITLTPQAIGAAQQMFEDNQFFKLVEELLPQKRPSVSRTLLLVPDQYALLAAQRPMNERLPMTPGQPDFVFADPEDGVIAVKNGEEILYASLYWRARFAVNGLARVHYLTPGTAHVATVYEQTQFEPSGQTYVRPNHTTLGYGNGGPTYPDKPDSANAGERMPIAKAPDDVRVEPGSENPYAGRAEFYGLRYGSYLIGMNPGQRGTRYLDVPDELRSMTAKELVSGKTVSLTSTVAVEPQQTVVFYTGH